MALARLMLAALVAGASAEVTAQSLVGRYLVIFEPEVSDAQMDTIGAEIVSRGGSIHRRFTTVVRGFSASMPPEYASQLEAMPNVTVEGEGLVHATPHVAMPAAEKPELRHTTRGSARMPRP